MKYLVAIIVWGFLSIYLMISSIIIGVFKEWFVFVYLGVYFLLLILGMFDAIREDKKIGLIKDERGEYY